MKLSLKTILTEAKKKSSTPPQSQQDDLEAWSRGLDVDDEGNHPGNTLQQMGAQYSRGQTDVQKVWGGQPIERPGAQNIDPGVKYGKLNPVPEAPINTKALESILKNASKRGSYVSLSDEEMAQLRQLAPAGDLENLLHGLLDSNNPKEKRLGNMLVRLGIEDSSESQNINFHQQPNIPHNLGGGKNALNQKDLTPQASYDQLAAQNPSAPARVTPMYDQPSATKQLPRTRSKTVSPTNTTMTAPPMSLSNVMNQVTNEPGTAADIPSAKRKK